MTQYCCSKCGGYEKYPIKSGTTFTCSLCCHIMSIAFEDMARQADKLAMRNTRNKKVSVRIPRQHRTLATAKITKRD